ncbi:MAG: serine/threonine-protein kinase [Clostridia bacterium]|nr:serine/threonine-protein kinase [Clostridia bacterium]MDY5554871.1 serine/threonine-protein kinase [Blautia sp.]
MNSQSEQYEKDFFFDRVQNIRIISESEKRKVEQIFYKPRETFCIMKTYYSKDLTEMYQKLKDISNENLAAVYDVSFFDGNTYVIEENIDGISLEEYLEMYGTFKENDVINIIKQVCHALEELHSQNPPIIHRDIKPSNIMLRRDGTVKLIDFDAARSYKEEKERDTILLGTREYASPEHYGYGQTDKTSDIYSIGVTMNELLTGKLPEKNQASYKGRLLPVINRCIQVDSHKRFPSVRQLSKTLSSYQSPWGFFARNRKKIAVCFTFLIIISASLFLFYTKREQWPDLQSAYEEEISPRLLLENVKVDQSLKKMLGTKYDYVKECLYTIDSDVKYTDGIYFMKGGMPGLYSIMEAAVTLTDDGQIECGFLQNGICNYYASDASLYESPSWYMIQWMASCEESDIYFHRQNPEPEQITGIYLREDSAASITIQESHKGEYSVHGQAVWGINTGQIEGTLNKINPHKFSYVEDMGGYRAELRVITYGSKLFVTTLEGSFGGLNVSFDGTYNKQ